MDYIFFKLKSLKPSSVQCHAMGIGLGIVAVIVFGAVAVPQSSIVQPFYNEQLPWRTEAPNIKFHKASGDSVELKELRGRKLGLLFMSPTCEFSQELKHELIESIKGLQFDQLYFISYGTVDANDNSRQSDELAHGFSTRFSVVQDTTGEIFRTYKIAGVPSVYWISEEGIVVDFAVGFASSLRLVSRLARSH